MPNRSVPPAGYPPGAAAPPGSVRCRFPACGQSDADAKLPGFVVTAQVPVDIRRSLSARGL
jgi:hypothetical protein